MALLSSFLPALLTNYFANSNPEEDHIDCVDHDRTLSEVQKDRCRSARDVVLAWKSGESLVAYLIMGVLFGPSLGRWSDFFGRKPFICLGFGAGTLTPIAILLNTKFGFHLGW